MVTFFLVIRKCAIHMTQPLCFFFYGLSSSLLSDLNTSKLVPIPRANTQILMQFLMQLLNILQDKRVYVLVLLVIVRQKKLTAGECASVLNLQLTEGLESFELQVNFLANICSIFLEGNSQTVELKSKEMKIKLKFRRQKNLSYLFVFI